MKLFIKGMMCGHCKMRVENSLSSLNGVESVEVDLETGTAEIKSSKVIEFAILKEAIEDAGYDLLKVE